MLNPTHSLTSLIETFPQKLWSDFSESHS